MDRSRLRIGTSHTAKVVTMHFHLASVRTAYLKILLATLLIVSCSGPIGPKLLTGTPAGMGDGCFLFGVLGRLEVDAEHGTAIQGDEGTQTNKRYVVAWRPGYTTRLAGSELEVLGPDGNLVATTGTHVYVEGGFVRKDAWSGLTENVFYACGAVTVM
jgi:hypothetical protein